MKRFQFNNYIIYLYTDKTKYFSKYPKKIICNWIRGIIRKPFTKKSNNAWADMSNKEIHFLIHPDTKFRNMLILVSHELGHLAKGIKSNPPYSKKNIRALENKANQFEKFALNSYDLTSKIYPYIKYAVPRN